MAYDEGIAEIIRDDLSDRSGIVEKKMFGGLCFMMDGNMLCGTYRDGGMYRVGERNEAAALDLPEVRQMDFTGRPMKGFVLCGGGTFANDDLRRTLLGLALDFVGAMPPK